MDDNRVLKHITVELDFIQDIDIIGLHEVLLKLTAEKYLKLFNLMQNKMNDAYNVEKILIKIPEEDVIYE